MHLPLLLTLVIAADPAGSDSWPGFRNDGSGRTAARELPLRWSPAENVAWKAALSGYGQSSPVVWRGRVFVTAVEGQEKEKCLVAAFDEAGGKRLWIHEFDASQRGRNSPMSSRAASTPVADADGVYALFESGDLVGLSHAGEVRWRRSLVREYGPIKNHHELASSLAQTEQAAIALIDHGGPSYLLAVEKATGKTLWKAERKGCLSWTSPLVAAHEGRRLVLASGGGFLSCYDALTGKELWDLGGLAGNDIPSPTVADGLVFLAGGENPLKPDKDEKSKALGGLKLTLKEGRPGYEVLWQARSPMGYHASPVFHEGHLYVVTKAGVLHCLDAKTGESRYSERLGGPCGATPVAAGDHLYFFGTDGATTVIKAGPTFEKVASNRLWRDEDFQAAREAERRRPENQVPTSPGVSKEQAEQLLDEAVGDVVYGVAAVDGAFYVRSGTVLYCLRKAGGP